MLVQLLRCLTLKLTSVFHCQLQKAVVSSSLLVVVYRNRTMLLPNTSVKISRLCRQRLSSLCSICQRLYGKFIVSFLILLDAA
jgi:hypothetical protein